MSTDPHQQRLEDAIKRRDAVQRKVQQLQGRLSAAQDEKTSIEKECTARGVEPEKLNAAISQLERRYEAAVTAFEKDVAIAEGKLAPYMEDRT